MSIKAFEKLCIGLCSFFKSNDNLFDKKNEQLINSSFGYGFNKERPIDSLNYSSEKNNNLPQNNNITQMEQSIECICRIYGINKREDKIKLMERITGTPIGLLAKRGDVNNYLAKALARAAGKIGPNVSKEQFIKEVGKLANDYYIALRTDWDLEEYDTAQKQMEFRVSLNLTNIKNPATNKNYTKKDLKNKKILEKAMSQYALDNYKKDIKEKINTASTPEEINAIEQSAIKKELKNMGLMVTNAEGEDINILHEYIPHLYAQNRVTGYEILFESRETVQERSKLADKSTPEYFMKIFTKPDLLGHKVSNDDKVSMVVTGTRYQSFEGRKSFHNKMEQTLSSIENKRERGIELTDYEKVIEAECKHLATGEFIGTADSFVLSANQSKSLAIQLNADAFSHGEEYYRDVLGEVNNYAECHPENLTKSITEFTSFMDEVTNNNYQIVVNDIKNNTTTKLNSPPDDIIPTKYKLGFQGSVSYSCKDDDYLSKDIETSDLNTKNKENASDTNSKYTNDKIFYNLHHNDESDTTNLAINNNENITTNNRTQKSKNGNCYSQIDTLVSTPILRKSPLSANTNMTSFTNNNYDENYDNNSQNNATQKEQNDLAEEKSSYITKTQDKKIKTQSKLLKYIVSSPDKAYKELIAGNSNIDKNDIIATIRTSSFATQLDIVASTKDSRFITFLIDNGALNEKTIAYLDQHKNLTDAGAVRYEIQQKHKENQKKNHCSAA